MTENNKHRINRKSEVLSRTGLSKTTLYARINSGLFPPPISLGPRAVGFVQHEVDQVLAYMIAGKSESELKKFVARLVEKRSEVALEA